MTEQGSSADEIVYSYTMRYIHKLGSKARVPMHKLYTAKHNMLLTKTRNTNWKGLQGLGHWQLVLY